jgi:hypothetical protein
LLRAIPNVKNYYTSSGMGNWAVNPFAFRPNQQRDPDGISLFREDFVSPLEVAQRNTHKKGVRVVRIKASRVMRLGLDPTPDPLPTSELPGHIVIPKMRWKQFPTTGEAEQIADWEIKLAEHATKNGVLNPLNLKDP